MKLTPSTVRFDLKCGRGAISQGEKCHKGPATKKKQESLLTAGNIAKVGAAFAAPFALQAALKSKGGKYVSSVVRTLAASIGKKPFPPGKSKTDWFELPNGPGIREGNRMRRYEANARMRGISHEEFADQVKNVAGKTRESEAVAELIRKNKVSVDSALLDDIIDSPSGRALDPSTRQSLVDFRNQQKTNPQAEGLFLDPGVLSNAPPNKVYINYRRNSTTEWKPSRKGVSKAMIDYKVARETSVKTQADLQGDPSPEKVEAFTRAFTTYQNADADDRDLILGLHEIGHSLDIGIGKRARPLTVRDPQTGTTWATRDPEFERQAGKVTSHYGLSDLKGVRNEFFSETFVLYTLEPSYLRREAPLVYTWMDDYIAQLRQK